MEDKRSNPSFPKGQSNGHHTCDKSTSPTHESTSSSEGMSQHTISSNCTCGSHSQQSSPPTVDLQSSSLVDKLSLSYTNPVSDLSPNITAIQEPSSPRLPSVLKSLECDHSLNTTAQSTEPYTIACRLHQQSSTNRRKPVHLYRLPASNMENGQSNKHHKQSKALSSCSHEEDGEDGLADHCMTPESPDECTPSLLGSRTVACSASSDDTFFERESRDLLSSRSFPRKRARLDETLFTNCDRIQSKSDDECPRTGMVERFVDRRQPKHLSFDDGKHSPEELRKLQIRQSNREAARRCRERRRLHIERLECTVQRYEAKIAKLQTDNHELQKEVSHLKGFILRHMENVPATIIWKRVDSDCGGVYPVGLSTQIGGTTCDLSGARETPSNRGTTTEAPLHPQCCDDCAATVFKKELTGRSGEPSLRVAATRPASPLNLSVCQEKAETVEDGCTNKANEPSFNGCESGDSDTAAQTDLRSVSCNENAGIQERSVNSLETTSEFPCTKCKNCQC